MARLPWFRVFSEARTDRKLDTLTDSQHRVWFALMCYAHEQTGRRMCIEGEMADDRETLAVEVSRCDADLLESTLSQCVKLKILAITPGLIKFIHGEERQYDKPSDVPSATKARKDKSRDTSDDGSSSRAVTPCHAKPALEESREEKKRVDLRAANRAPKCFTPSDREQIAAKIAVRFPSSTDADIDKAVESLLAGCDKQCSGLHSCWVAFFDAKLAKAKSVAGLVRFLSEDGRAA